jgi:hypothetical protein
MAVQSSFGFSHNVQEIACAGSLDVPAKTPVELAGSDGSSASLI